MPRLLPCLFVLALILRAIPAATADSQDSRRDALLHSIAERPYPPSGAWHTISWLMGACHTGEQMPAAVEELRQLRDQMRSRAASLPAGEAAEGEDDGGLFTHWHAYLLERIWFLFAHPSDPKRGRLDPAAEPLLCEILWLWAEPLCQQELASPERTWDIWGSENHHLMMWTSLWGAAQLFAAHPAYQTKKFRDGSSPAAALAAFEAYFKRYARERATKGLLVECASPTYAKYSLGCWYNLADFSRDEELRRLFGLLLDVYWADWALDQIDGVRAGSRHRNYPGDPSQDGGATSDAAWYHFGIGSPKSRHPGTLCAATSLWRPDPVVAKLVEGKVGPATFVARSRRPGLLRPDAKDGAGFLAKPGHPFSQGVYQLNPGGGDLLRSTYRTPDFVLGTTLLPAYPSERWSRISSQNRLDGVIFGGRPTARIFAQPPPPKRGSVYNAQWSVHSQGSLILQRLKGSNAQGQRVWFTPSLAREERDGWVFVQAPRAYAAVRVISGGADWQDDPALPGSGKSPWLSLRDEFSPVILEVAAKDAVPDFSTFQQKMLATAITSANGRLDYTSPFSNTRLTLFTDQSQLPQIDGKPLDLNPALAYDSPFLTAQFGGATVTIRAGLDAVRLDFAKARRESLPGK